MLWDLIQQMQIHSALARADAADPRATRAETRSTITKSDLTELRDTVDRLTLACCALWELHKQTSGLTDEQLVAKITELDLRDGTYDDRVSTQKRHCPRCTRPNVHSRRTCTFCGAPLEPPPPFPTTT